MNSLRTLALVSLLVAAGCVGGPGGQPSPTATPSPSPPASPADSPSPPASPSDTPVEAPYPNTTADIGDGPKRAPQRPATLTESTVSDYVQTFEYRYAYNALWYNEHSEVSLECSAESVTPVASGYNVTVSCYGYSNTGGETSGTETATEVHADWGTQTIRYYVDWNSTIRFGRVETS